MNRWLFVILFLPILAFCIGSGTSPSIREVKTRHETELLALPGVVSIGIGQDKEGHPAIIVGLDRTRPETEAQLPERLEGYPVLVQLVGRIKAQ